MLVCYFTPQLRIFRSHGDVSNVRCHGLCSVHKVLGLVGINIVSRQLLYRATGFFLGNLCSERCVQIAHRKPIIMSIYVFLYANKKLEYEKIHLLNTGLIFCPYNLSLNQMLSGMFQDDCKAVFIHWFWLRIASFTRFRPLARGRSTGDAYSYQAPDATSGISRGPFHHALISVLFLGGRGD